MGWPPLGGGRLSFLSLSPMNQCTHGLWSRLGTPRVPLVHLVLQACSGRFPCKCGPRPLRAGRRRGPAPPTATPLGFQPCGRSSWVFRPWQYLVTKYPLSVAQRESPERVFLRLQAFCVFVRARDGASRPYKETPSVFRAILRISSNDQYWKKLPVFTGFSDVFPYFYEVRVVNFFYVRPGI